MLTQTLRQSTLVALALVAAASAAAIDPQQAEDLARSALRERAPRLGLAATDVAELVVTDSYRSSHNGLTHVYLRQRLGGIDVVNGTATVNLDAEGALVSVAQSLVANLAAQSAGRSAGLDREPAIRAAAVALGLSWGGAVELLEELGGASREAIYVARELSLDPIPIRLVYYRTDDGGVALAWDLLIRQPDQQHWWHLWIDAASGELLAKVDWIARDTYQVFALPKESPNDGPRTVETNPADPTASPFGWHDTDGAAGAEFTDTRGNNVQAQEDRDGNNFGGFRPDGGAGLDFQFPLDLTTQQPADYQAAAIANLFYWNNVLHDVLYQYGFDEAAGNFQQNNYGNGGLGGDWVNADAQDGSGTNNANFATPPDGSNPRMQMFEWLAPPDLTVNSPPAIAGSYAAAGASFGPPLGVAGVTGDLELVDDGSASGSEGCGALVGFTPGRIAVIDRGTCEFGTKVLNAENAGAVAAVVVNNQGDGLVSMGGGASGGSVTIPSLFIGQSDGATIQAELPGVNAKLSKAGLDRDSDLDNGVIAHEYCHGLSNRLTGGPGNSSCLSGSQQAGEGWSDLCALFFSTVASDTGADGHGVGTYLVFQAATGGGIRPFPYSTDLGVNPLTYGDLTNAGQAGGVSIPHGVGTVWATAAWEVYWNLVDKYGFDPDLYAGSGGNNLWMQLLLDGMKMQGCNPTFLDARDAILAADAAANGGANACEIWLGFAKRGMGLSADDGGGSGSLAVTEAFDAPAECTNTAPVVAITSPADMATFDVADSVPFAATADDTEEGDVRAGLDWTSSLDGAVGSGGSFSSSLSVGLHTVTAAVTDTGGLAGEATIRVVVDDAPGCVADRVVTGVTVSGAADFDGVNSVTVGPSTILDGTSVVTVEAGNFVHLEGTVSVLGMLTIANTATPCP